MIEIGLGVVAVCAAAAVAFGLTDGLIPFPLGTGAVVAAIIAGVALILRGAYRTAKRRTPEPHALRSLGAAMTLGGLALVTALALPSLSETLNLVTVSGFPLGLYVMGQGVLIFFVVLLFAFAIWQGKVDRAGQP